MKFEFELDDVDVQKLVDLLNGDRCKYMSLITKCVVSDNYLYKGMYTVQVCLTGIKRIDELEATIFGHEVQYTYDEQAIAELTPYHHRVE